MDGTLLDTETVYARTFSEVLGRYGAEYTDEMRFRMMGAIQRDVFAAFINELNIPLSIEDLSAEMRVELNMSLQDTEFLPGAVELIAHLKKHNIPIAVATSSGAEIFEVKTKRHKAVFDQFCHIVTGSTDPEVARGKPAPDIFLVCASRFAENPPPSECLVFEDSPNGVQGAVAAGMQVVMIPDVIVPEEMRKPATKVISSLLEFIPEEFGLPKFEYLSTTLYCTHPDPIRQL